MLRLIDHLAGLAAHEVIISRRKGVGRQMPTEQGHHALIGRTLGRLCTGLRIPQRLAEIKRNTTDKSSPQVLETAHSLPLL
jgi:hypothetical protein